jgi:DNA-binding FrmR family transcriptional regulator
MDCNDKADLKNRLSDIENHIDALRKQIEKAKQYHSVPDTTIRAWEAELANLLKELEEIQTELNS